MKTYKELIWEELREISKSPEKKNTLDLPKMARKIGCSFAHISITLRHARDAGLLEFGEDGGYIISQIPISFEEFDEKTLEISRERRANAKGTGAPRGIFTAGTRMSTKKLPELDEDNVLKVISKVLLERKEALSKVKTLEEENLKLKKIAISLKKKFDAVIAKELDSF